MVQQFNKKKLDKYFYRTRKAILQNNIPKTKEYLSHLKYYVLSGGGKYEEEARTLFASITSLVNEIPKMKSESQAQTQQLQETVQKQKEAIVAKDAAVKQQQDLVQARDASIRQKDDSIRQKDEAIRQKDDAIRQKDETIRQQEGLVQARDATIQQQQATNATLETRVEELTKQAQTLREQLTRELADLETRLKAESETQITKLRGEKESQTQQYKATLQRAKTQISESVQALGVAERKHESEIQALTKRITDCAEELARVKSEAEALTNRNAALNIVNQKAIENIEKLNQLVVSIKGILQAVNQNLGSAIILIGQTQNASVELMRTIQEQREQIDRLTTAYAEANRLKAEAESKAEEANRLKGMAEQQAQEANRLNDEAQVAVLDANRLKEAALKRAQDAEKKQAETVSAALKSMEQTDALKEQAVSQARIANEKAEKAEEERDAAIARAAVANDRAVNEADAKRALANENTALTAQLQEAQEGKSKAEAEAALSTAEAQQVIAQMRALEQLIREKLGVPANAGNA